MVFEKLEGAGDGDACGLLAIRRVMFEDFVCGGDNTLRCIGLVFPRLH